MPWDETDVYEDTINYDSCPACKTSGIVPPYGINESPILIVGDSPGDDEISSGRPFSGATGRVLKSELRFLGLRLRDFRVMNMWQHKANKKQPECFEIGVQAVLEEAKGRKMIVLVGADTVKYFTGEKVSDWNGLFCPSKILGQDVFVMIQPTVVFHKNLGEVRFAVQQFAKHAKKLLEEN